MLKIYALVGFHIALGFWHSMFPFVSYFRYVLVSPGFFLIYAFVFAAMFLLDFG